MSASKAGQMRGPARRWLRRHRRRKASDPIGQTRLSRTGETSQTWKQVGLTQNQTVPHRQGRRLPLNRKARNPRRASYKPFGRVRNTLYSQAQRVSNRLRSKLLRCRVAVTENSMQPKQREYHARLGTALVLLGTTVLSALLVGTATASDDSPGDLVGYASSVTSNSDDCVQVFVTPPGVWIDPQCAEHLL